METIALVVGMGAAVSGTIYASRRDARAVEQRMEQSLVDKIRPDLNHLLNNVEVLNGKVDSLAEKVNRLVGRQEERDKRDKKGS